MPQVIKVHTVLDAFSALEPESQLHQGVYLWMRLQHPKVESIRQDHACDAGHKTPFIHTER